MIGAMRSYQVNIASIDDVTVAVDDVVIAHVGETTVFVPATDVIYGVVAALRRGRAMHDDLIDESLALLEATRDKECKCLRTDDTIDRDAFPPLKLLDGFFGDNTIDAILNYFQPGTCQGLLYLENYFPTRTFSICYHSLHVFHIKWLDVSLRRLRSLATLLRFLWANGTLKFPVC